jgi:hypothetical protein
VAHHIEQCGEAPVAVPPVMWLDFARRSLRATDDIGSSCEVNWLIDGRCGKALQAIDLAHVIWLEASSVQNNMAAVSADGRKVCVLTACSASARRDASFWCGPLPGLSQFRFFPSLHCGLEFTFSTRRM